MKRDTRRDALPWAACVPEGVGYEYRRCDLIADRLCKYDNGKLAAELDDEGNRVERVQSRQNIVAFAALSLVPGCFAQESGDASDSRGWADAKEGEVVTLQGTVMVRSTIFKDHDHAGAEGHDDSVARPCELEYYLQRDPEDAAPLRLYFDGVTLPSRPAMRSPWWARGRPGTISPREEWPERLGDVLSAIYAAYGTGWDDVSGCSADLTEEAVFLGRLIVSLLPDEPEALGLLSLMLFCESRRNARRNEQGQFVPLVEQNVARWSRDQIIEADTLLITAARKGCFGRFQCEAAIQSVHAQRAITGILRRDALLLLYDLLFAHSPTVGVAVARAAALADAGNLDSAKAGLAAVRENAPTEIETYHPYWVTQARLMQHRGEIEIAREHLQRGIGLTEDPAVREYLKTWLHEMNQEK